ncbi:MAG: phosphopantetheine-binding protein, partial [Oscillospiraceae bacterium]
SEKEYLAPRSEKEKILASVFEEILQVEQIGIDDNFFELGGDSIKAIKLISILKTKGISVDIQKIIQGPTVSQINQEINKEKVVTLIDNSTNKSTLKRNIIEDLKNYDNGIDYSEFKTYKLPKANLDYYNLIEYNLMITSYKVKSEYSLSYIKECVEKLISSEEILRMRIKENKFEVANSNVKINIPVYCQSDGVTSKFTRSDSNNIQNAFESGMLARFMINQVEDAIEITIFVHHCIWDEVSNIILENKLNDIIRLGTLRKVNTVDKDHALIDVNTVKKEHSDFMKYVHQTKDIKKDNIEYITIEKELTEEEYREYLLDPIKYVVKQFIRENNITNIAKLPYMLLTHGRNNENSNSLGMYLTLIPTIYDVLNDKIYTSKSYNLRNLEMSENLLDEYNELVFNFKNILEINFGGVFNKENIVTDHEIIKPENLTIKVAQNGRIVSIFMPKITIQYK